MKAVAATFNQEKALVGAFSVITNLRMELFDALSASNVQDTATILGAENLDLLSPLIALDHGPAFPVVRAFLHHIFTQFQMLDELQVGTRHTPILDLL